MDAYTGVSPSHLTETTIDFGTFACSAFGYFFRINRDGAPERSSDGTTWTPVQGAPRLVSVNSAYEAGDFIFMVTRREVFAIREDGTAKNLDQLDLTRGIASSGSLYGAVYGLGYIARSSDGLNWHMQEMIRPSEYAMDIAFGEGRFIVITKEGNLYESTDLVSWDLVGGATDGTGRLLFFKGRFWLTTDPEATDPYNPREFGSGVQSFGYPPGQAPIVGLGGFFSDVAVLPRYSHLTVVPTAADPDGDLSSFTLDTSGSASWLIDLGDGVSRFTPDAVGNHALTLRAIDDTGNQATTTLRVEAKPTMPAVELPAGYLGRMNAAVRFRDEWWAFGLDARATHSRDGVEWHTVGLAPDSMRLMDVQPIGERLVGVTRDFRLVASEDGINWIEIRGPRSEGILVSLNCFRPAAVSTIGRIPSRP